MNVIDYSVNKTNLYEQIADKLEHAIVQSEIKEEKLPSEQELSKNFKVSRTVIREALKVLKERGLIQPRNGGGSYLARPKTNTVSGALDRIIQINNISSDNLHSTRLILETESARLAAINANSEDIKKLEVILQEMEDESISPEHRIWLDAEFHNNIARAGKNELLGIFIETMTLLLSDYMAKGMAGPIGINKTLKQHKKILEAIKKKDPKKAETALISHLIAAINNVKKHEQET